MLSKIGAPLIEARRRRGRRSERISKEGAGAKSVLQEHAPARGLQGIKPFHNPSLARPGDGRSRAGGETGSRPAIPQHFGPASAGPRFPHSGPAPPRAAARGPSPGAGSPAAGSRRGGSASTAARGHGRDG